MPSKNTALQTLNKRVGPILQDAQNSGRPMTRNNAVRQALKDDPALRARVLAEDPGQSPRAVVAMTAHAKNLTAAAAGPPKRWLADYNRAMDVVLETGCSLPEATKHLEQKAPVLSRRCLAAINHGKMSLEFWT